MKSSNTIYDFSDIQMSLSQTICKTTVKNSGKHEYSGQDKDKKEHNISSFYCKL